MTARVDQSVFLPDGRRVGFNEYGDLDGRPLFLHHAAFFARNIGAAVDSAAVNRGVRVICPDRPGVGLSDFDSWSFESAASDLAHLADSLGLDRFVVVGISGGGPHALAAAWRLPTRVIAVGLVGSVSPPVTEVVRNLSRGNPMRSPARRAPWLWGPQMWMMAAVMRRAPGVAVSALARMLSPWDRERLTRPETRRYFVEGMRESVRQGGRGWAHEARVTGSEAWGTWLSEIEVPVHIWQGEEDRLAPPVMGRYLNAVLPRSELKLLPGVGHLWGIDHFSEVLDTLVGA